MASLADYPADRHAIVAALDALGDGDARLAGAILLGALEDGPSERRCRCECGAAFEWPGLLDAHRLAVHYLDEIAA